MPKITAAGKEWEVTPMPEQHGEFTLENDCTPEELSRIRQGLTPETPEDRWLAYWEGDTLYIHRSWTGSCIFAAVFGEQITVTVNRDPSQFTAKSAAAERELFLETVNGLILNRKPQPKKGFRLFR